MKSPFMQQVVLIACSVPVPGLIVKVHGEDSAIATLSRDDDGHTQAGDRSPGYSEAQEWGCGGERDDPAQAEAQSQGERRETGLAGCGDGRRPPWGQEPVQEPCESHG